MSDFINSAVNTKVYNKMQDEHQIISIIDKEVIVKDIGTIVSGDTNSCLLSFEINRFQDGVDLCDKKIRFNYKNTNGIFYDIAVNVKYNDTTIRFSWLLPYSLTQPGGKSIASIEFYGYNEYDEQYSYKTKNFRLSIEKSIGITDESNKSDNNWVIQIENDVESIQNKIIEIEKDIKSINIPTKLSELQGDSEHRTVTDSQISTWNSFENNVQADWDEKDDKNNAFIKNKPDIPKVTNDLTDELKQLYDDAVIKKHTHMNNSVLDKITQNDIDTWNNKSEFDGNYSSLDNIPENLATEEYVDEKLSGKANDSELSVVAKSGSYNDLEDKPVPYDDTILSNRIKTIEDDYVKNADIPVNISELTNDNNYQTADDVAATLSTTLKAYAKSSDITNEINAEITKVVADAPESLDTLKELSDWILSHENDASAMNSAILDNKSNISSLQDNKVDKVSGKGLSTNDFTTGEKEKLAGLSNYDDSEIKNSIQQNANNIATKLNKNQGAANSGKIVGINDSGDIVPMFSQGLTYNEDTQCLEFGADEKLNLNSGIQLDETLSKTGYAADAAKVGETVSELKNDLSQLSEEIANQGVSSAVLQAIYDNLSVTAFDSDQMTQEQYNANLAIIKAAIDGNSGGGEVTLISISATYGGGEVAVGTALTDLTGIAVTAHYSDGTSETVTGYTLSGTITEGSNIITVSYGGKTTTFTVTGVAEETTERVWLANTANASIKDFYGIDSGAVVNITNHNNLDFVTSATVNRITPIIISDSDCYYLGTNKVPGAAQALPTYKHLSVGDVVTVEMTVNSATLTDFCAAGFMLGKTGATDVSQCIAITQVYGIQAGTVRTASVTIEEECDVSWFGLYNSQGLTAGDTFNATLSIKVNDEEILGEGVSV